VKDLPKKTRTMAITTTIESETSYTSWYMASEKAYAELFDQMAPVSTPAPLRREPLFTTPCPSSQTVDAKPLKAPQVSRKSPVNKRRTKKKAEVPSSLPAPDIELGDYVSPEEEDLRVAEAQILFPKYMERTNKRKSGDTKVSYLPSAEYGPWEQGLYRCPPKMKKPQLTRTLNYLNRDCREPGARLAENVSNPIESDPSYYDQEWNQRLKHNGPVYIDPPQKGSLAVTPTFSSRKVLDPSNRLAYDSFVLELKRQMGSKYIDPEELRYYPRNDARVAMWDEKSKTHKVKRNEQYDVELYLRNRDIERRVSRIKDLYENRGLLWNDEIAEEWENRIVRNVNPETVCAGRTHYSKERDLGIEHEKDASPEPLDPETIAPPAGMHEDDLGRDFYWSEKEGRMISMEQLRQKRKEIEEGDRIRSSPPEESQGMSTRSTHARTCLDRGQRVRPAEGATKLRYTSNIH
jgi:hypothetical protein